MIVDLCLNVLPFKYKQNIHLKFICDFINPRKKIDHEMLMSRMTTFLNFRVLDDRMMYFFSDKLYRANGIERITTVTDNIPTASNERCTILSTGCNR